MNFAVAELANVVLKKPLHECSLDELQQLTRQYPYFGPVQLLLAKKLSIASNELEDGSSLYEEQVQKTSLYFQNRVWLDYLLNGGGSDNSITDHPTITADEMLVVNEEQNQPAEFIASENKEEEIFAAPVTVETIEPAEVPVEIPTVHTEPIVEPLINENNGIQPITEYGEEDTTGKTAVPFDMPALKIEPLPANAGVIFEPYHTVDYFASQGIKFKEDERPKDRFSVQLKSFTEWLKIMKRIPVTEATSSDSIGDKKVEQMAEFSIAERHVITEAMAEVWQKQGNKAKAEDIYRKLSLLDPSKSSYFAMKIEDLKKPF